MKTLIFLVLTGLSFGFMAYAVEEGLDGFGDCDSVFEDGENDIDEVHFRFHGNYEGADQEVIQRLVERSQDAFESGAFDLAAISFALEKSYS